MFDIGDRDGISDGMRQEFHSAHKETSPHQAGDFASVRIGGPTCVGHYFVPACATAQS